MFRHMANHEQLQSVLYGKLRSGQFRAVIVDDLDSGKAEKGAADQFGPDFVAILRENYAESVRLVKGKKTLSVIYKPKSQLPSTQPAEPEIIRLPVRRRGW